MKKTELMKEKMNNKQVWNTIDIEKKETITLESHITDCVKSVDQCFGFILNRYSDIESSLSAQYDRILSGHIDQSLDFRIQPLVKDEIKTLDKNASLKLKLEKAVLSLMNITDYCIIDSGEISSKKELRISYQESIQSFYMPTYYLLEALAIETSDDKALALTKDYVADSFSEDVIKESTQDLEAFGEYMKKACNSTHNFTSQLLNKGIYIDKTTRCYWADVLKDVKKPELMYFIVCHDDYLKTPLYNQNFTMTRSKTLMQGYDCCDFCYHDKRYIELIKHPDNEFWKTF